MGVSTSFMPPVAEVRLPIKDQWSAMVLSGHNEENLKQLEAELGIQATVQKDELVLSGDAEAVNLGVRLVEALWRGDAVPNPGDVRYAIEQLRSDPCAELGTLYTEVVLTTRSGKPIKAKTLRQQEYVRAIAAKPLVFGLGPAGTGKTYLAVAMAVLALQEKRVRKLVLTRPAVEAGESLGYLPGDFQAKVDPYLRPLYDALGELMEADRFQKELERGTIEICPLAYMRGRTLNEAFIILDEAQNTTPEQIKMFLTRMGWGSRIVVTGDPTQIDLHGSKRSGLAGLQQILGHLSEIAFVRFANPDVVRHDLVRRILDAYDRRNVEGEA